MGDRRISDETAVVLELFLSEPTQARYGREIIIKTGLRSGSLYPMLRRLEKRGFLFSEWEDVETALETGRRPRRLYKLNGRRSEEAEGLIAEWRAALPLRPNQIGPELPA